MQCVHIDTHESRLNRMRQGVLTSARLLDVAAKQEDSRSWCAFVTLTFRESETFQKKCVSAFLHRVRAWYVRRDVSFRYVWVGELTKRGRLHYHLMFWLPRGLTLPKPDTRGWWSYGSSRIERARHAVAYLAKYASKGSGERSAFPKGARISGSGGLSASAADERRWWLSPSWIRDLVPIASRPFRNEGGGFVCRATGELFASPWRVVGIANGFVRVVFVGSAPCSS